MTYRGVYLKFIASYVSFPQIAIIYSFLSKFKLHGVIYNVQSNPTSVGLNLQTNLHFSLYFALAIPLKLV